MQSTDEEFLDTLLRKITNNGHILTEDYSQLTSLFAPTIPPSTRAKAFLVLSSVCDHHRRSSRGSTAEDDPGTHNILHSFLPSVEGRLADVEERPLLEALSFVAALFAVDWRAASAIFARDGFQDSMMDCLDLFPPSMAFSSVVSNILSSACGYKSCRAALSPRCPTWLESIFRYTNDVKLKSAASLALLKSFKGTGPEGADVGGIIGERAQVEERTDELFKSLRDIVVSSSGHVLDLADAVECLVYLSTKPSIKTRIVDDDEFLKKIMSFQSSLQPRPSSAEDLGTTPFGLAALIANISSYRPRLTEEQAQIERLKRMAQPDTSKTDATSDHSSLDEQFDDDEHVRLRGKRLVAAGAADLLVAIARATKSAATKAVVGKALLGLVEDKDNRGRILQSGGAKALIAIIQVSQHTSDAQSTIPLGKANMEFYDLPSTQALAKLAITASPMQVFGPNENTSIEAIRPLSCLLLHSSSTLLQRFEAIMALTNLASASPELADRIARTDGVFSKLEFLMLEEHRLLRRAATELICNLVAGCEMAFNRFSGDDDRSSEDFNQSKSRLHVLTALADVEDVPTRLAASGALAILTGSPTAGGLVMLLEFEHHRVFPVLKQLIDPSEDDGEHKHEGPQRNPGLVHRGVVCIRNICLNLSDDSLRSKLASEVVRHGMANALTKIIQSAEQCNMTEVILRPAAEALKWLMDSGVNVIM